MDNWRSIAKDVIRAREEIRQFYTGGEARQKESELHDVIERLYPLFEKSALGELFERANSVLDAYDSESLARRSEANSWSSERLLTEIQLATSKVGLAMKRPAAGGIFSGKDTRASELAEALEEAMASGDKYKLRAGLEVIGAEAMRLPAAERSGVLTDRIVDARAKLEAERSTSWMLNAADKTRQAEQNFQKVYEGVRHAAVALGQDDPLNPLAGGGLAYNYRRLKIGKDGKLQVLRPDDAEVTRVIFRDNDTQNAPGWSAALGGHVTVVDKASTDGI